VRFYPKIIEFLGYNPLPEPKTRGQEVARARMNRGWSRHHLATVAGVDERTVARIEEDAPGTAPRLLQRVTEILKNPDPI